MRDGGGTSSFVGTGVGATVVLTLAVATGPTKRSQRSLTVMTTEDANADGFAGDVPLLLTVGEGFVVAAPASETSFAAQATSTGAVNLIF